MVAELGSLPGVSLESLGTSLDGRELDLLTIGGPWGWVDGRAAALSGMCGGVTILQWCLCSRAISRSPAARCHLPPAFHARCRRRAWPR